MASGDRVPIIINPLNAELNPICHLLALLGAHHILHVSRIRVNWNKLMRMLVFLTYIYHDGWFGECEVYKRRNYSIHF
jgi:hypothetical protein